jgi:hypothetical protein
MSEAIGLLLTFSTYGTHLHGAETGSVDRGCRNWGAPVIDIDPALERRATRLMPERPLLLAAEDREIVLAAIVGAANHRGWPLYCAHIRTTHAHLIMKPDISAERTLAYVKARATFSLKVRHMSRERFWTKHGSTRYLWNRAGLFAALDYVIDQQGPAMSTYCAESSAIQS